MTDLALWINAPQVQLLNSLHYNLDHYWLLTNIYYSNISNLTYIPEGVKATLIRKNLCTNDLVITNEGIILYEKVRDCTEFIDAKSIRKEIKAVRGEYNKKFLEFWELFPVGDNWVENGREFNGSRSFKIKKDDCEKKYIELLTKYTHENIILGLNYDIFLKKKQSLHTGENKFKYMQNSLTYLNSESFAGFINMATANKWKPSSDLNKVNDQPVETINLF